MDLRSLRALYNVPGESSATMDGKDIVQVWFRLERPPHAEYLELADQIDAALAQARREGQEAMRERAAVFQCYHCQQGKPIDHIDGGRAFHLDSKGCPTYCTGQDIRALPVE